MELQANLVGLLQQASKQLRRRVYNSPQWDQNIKVVFHTLKILKDYHVHIISQNCTFSRGAMLFEYRPEILLDVFEDTIELMINKFYGVIALWWLSVSLWRICIIYFDQVNILHR